MKSGYEAELNNHQKKLNDSKADLEEFYAARHEDKDIAGPLKDRYDDMITKADATILSFTTGVKLVKAAIVPRLFFTEMFNKKHIGHTDGDEIVQPSHGI